VIVIVAYFLIGLDVPVFMKYPLLAFMSFSIIMLSYEFIVRRIRIARFLFGMKTDIPDRVENRHG
jgi:hypothetical protein